MQANTFWQTIYDARSRTSDPLDGDEVARAAAAILATMAADDVIGFAVFFEGLNDASYRWDLWAAAYLINGGCSDDGFDYFRGWLVAQGQKVWEAALADPDSLADLPIDPDGETEVEAEDMLRVALTAYGLITGDEDAYWEALPERADGGNIGGPAGEDFDFDDDAEMRRRFPRLSAIHLPAGE
jgi:hypothetical protein